MNYYEGIDYFVCRMDFPNMASAGVSQSNGDGTFTIFINSLFCEPRRGEALEHELAHLKENHFFREGEVVNLEREACRLAKKAEMARELEPDVWMELLAGWG